MIETRIEDSYWIVADSTTQVYASGRADYVTLPDSAYTAWLAAGNAPAKIATEAELFGILAVVAPSGLSAANLATANHVHMTAQLSNGLQSSKIARAILLAILDEFNTHALKHNAILDAIDGSSTLAQVKTAIAAINDYPARTKAQMITSITNKINAGEADT